MLELDLQKVKTDDEIRVLDRRIESGIDKTDFQRKEEMKNEIFMKMGQAKNCLLYTSPSPRDRTRSRMPSSA